MAYVPGSKLEVTGENGGLASYVMVLSDNKVMFIGHTFNGEMMSLTDWLILAEGREMQVNSLEKADAIWSHAKQKSGIDPPSLAHVDEYEQKVSKLPQLLVPPPVPHGCETCDAFEFSDCETEATVATAPIAMTMQSPSSPAAAPELRFPPPLPEETYPQRHFGDKLKWQLNDETYRIVVFTEKGVLQVKSVTDGGGETHSKECKCAACFEYKTHAPWRPRAPLAKAFFETEKAWRESLPKGGKLLTKAVRDSVWY